MRPNVTSMYNKTFAKVESAKSVGATTTDNMDFGQSISELFLKALVLRLICSAETLLLHTRVLWKLRTTLVRPQLEYAASICNPNSKLQINLIEKVKRTSAHQTCRRLSDTSSAGKYLMNLSGHLLMPLEIGPPRFSSIRYIVELCQL